jgi:excinuclease UvrABC nuclease subunit
MNIKGIGKETIKKLVDKFGSVQQIKKQNDEELLKVLSQGQLSSLRSKFPACGEEGVVKGE